MEDVARVYKREHNPDMTAVCMDEKSKQLIVETRFAIPARLGRRACYDYEYKRNRTCNLFMLYE